MVHYIDVFPFSKEKANDVLLKGKKLISVENNSTGQFAQVLRMYTGIEVDQQILRYDGRPLSPEYILERIELEK